MDYERYFQDGTIELTPSELAKVMLEWEELRRKLNEIEQVITRQVGLIGKTQVVGNVRARFESARKVYDYEGAARKELTEQGIAAYTTTELVTKTDWRKACLDNSLDVPFQYQGTPTVKIILEG